MSPEFAFKILSNFFCSHESILDYCRLKNKLIKGRERAKHFGKKKKKKKEITMILICTGLLLLDDLWVWWEMVFWFKFFTKHHKKLYIYTHTHILILSYLLKADLYKQGNRVRRSESIDRDWLTIAGFGSFHGIYKQWGKCRTLTVHHLRLCSG